MAFAVVMFLLEGVREYFCRFGRFLKFYRIVFIAIEVCRRGL